MSQSVNLGGKPAQPAVRDALHIAVISMPAGDWLNPGEPVRIYSGTVVGCDRNDKDCIGVVDPYISYAAKDDLVWVCLNPNTVTTVQHVWEHPAFDISALKPLPKPTKEESEAWLRDFCSKADCPDYDILIAAATDQKVEPADEDYYPVAYKLTDEYLHFGGRDAHGRIPFEMWDHIENVTGEKCFLRPKRFSCSC